MVKINNIINNNKFLAKGMNGLVYLVKDNKNNIYLYKFFKFFFYISHNII